MGNRYHYDKNGKYTGYSSDNPPNIPINPDDVQLGLKVILVILSCFVTVVSFSLSGRYIAGFYNNSIKAEGSLYGIVLGLFYFMIINDIIIENIHIFCCILSFASIGFLINGIEGLAFGSSIFLIIYPLIVYLINNNRPQRR